MLCSAPITIMPLHLPIPESVYPGLLILLRVLFFLMLALTVAGLMRSPSAASRKKIPAIIHLLSAGMLITLLALLGYQATWQLAGFMRPQFVAFMRNYDQRPGEGRFLRGDIVDRNNRILATSRPEDARQRTYPLGPDAAHLLGYWDRRFGAAGVEAAEAAALGGQVLATTADVNRFGRNLLLHRQGKGDTIRLTLDARLQQTAMRLLNHRPGAVVVIRPTTGELLALASSPSFDPNALASQMERQTAQDAPMFNRAVNGRYPPGSTFKAVLAGIAYTAGITPVLDCPAGGFIPEPGAPPIRDHEFYAYAREDRPWRGHGKLALPTAFRLSSNSYFAHLGSLLGADRIESWWRNSFLTDSLVLLAGSSSSLTAPAAELPRLTPANRREVAQISIGQGALLTSPLHMAALTAAIANDGRLRRPHVRAQTTPPAAETLFPTASARSVARIMRDAVRHGTGRGADLPGLAVAGKTGTAQTTRGEDHSWFVCFAPYPDAQIAMAVLLEHAGYGSAAAVPLAAELLKTAQDLGLLSSIMEGHNP